MIHLPLLDEISRIVDESSHKLYQRASPPVRYYLLTDIMGRKEDDPLVLRVVKECERCRPKIKLLQSLRPDGTWPISKQRRIAEERGPGPPYGWTYITMLRNLYALNEYQTRPEEGRVQAVLERILSWQAREGYIPGPWGVGLALPHYNGFALRELISYGMEEDRRVKRLVAWLMDRQRPDGGWIIPYLEDVKYLPEYRHLTQEDFLEMVKSGKVIAYHPSSFHDVPSCVWTTVMVVRGMCQSYRLAQKREIRRGAGFFLDRFFRPNHHSLLYRSADNWTKLKYPSYFGSGLCALDLLTWLGYGAHDLRMEKPIKWLLSARLSDGLWSQTERPHAEKDQWITEIALSVLNRYAQSLRGEPFGMGAELMKFER